MSAFSLVCAFLLCGHGLLVVALKTESSTGGKGEVYFEDSFDSEPWDRWVHSEWTGSEGPMKSFEWGAGDNPINESSQKGLMTNNDHAFHAASAKFAKPFSNKGKELIVQYTVRHERWHKKFCGGGYIKLLGSDIDQKNFSSHSEFKILFGPDVCDTKHTRIHLIFHFKGKRLQRKEDMKVMNDHLNYLPHLYTLRVFPNNTYKVYVNMAIRKEGKLHGEWDFHPKSHPEFVHDVHAHEDIGAVGFALWSRDDGSVFDDVLVCDDFEYAKAAWNKTVQAIHEERKVKWLEEEAVRKKREQEEKDLRRKRRAEAERQRKKERERERKRYRSRMRERDRDRDRDGGRRKKRRYDDDDEDMSMSRYKHRRYDYDDEDDDYLHDYDDDDDRDDDEDDDYEEYWHEDEDIYEDHDDL